MNEMGLTSQEAKARLVKYGANQLDKKKEFKVFKLIWQQFKSPLVYILVLAVGVTLFLGEINDALVIGLAVVVNTILGFWQEFKAEKSLEALSAALTPKTKVLRDGEWQQIPVKQVVPGDLVRLELGVRIPADGLVIEANSLSVEEAILTGESEAVEKLACKDRVFTSDVKTRSLHMVFMGTSVASGIGVMQVMRIGMNTKMGQIAHHLKTTEEETTPLQKQISKLSQILAIIVAGVTLVLFFGGILKGEPWLLMFETAVAVAVAAIPEGLVISLTAILALGMQRILAKKAVVRKLIAAETLGATSVICCDKTGTLTEGKMKVIKADTPDKNMLIKAAVLCNDMRDPLEIAMLDWAGGQANQIEKEYDRLDGLPFDPQYKYIATLHSNLLLVSGAPEVILKKSNLSKKQQTSWLKKLEVYAKKSYRLVGFAYNDQIKSKKIKEETIRDLNWLGVLVYEDPVRESVADALAETRLAGIDIKVITGDFKDTAAAVIDKLDLVKGGIKDNQIITGEQLNKMDDKNLKKKMKKIILFARTDPVQKLKIVRILQELGEVVAMTGDGVNDAPALKKADIGIVVDSASDVSKQTAEIVLLDSNFKTILSAVEEGRKIWQNIRKVVTYLLSDSFTEVLLIGGSILLRLPLPILATQILWVNLIEDGLPGLALVFEGESNEVLQEPPRKKSEPILNLEMKALIFIIGVITDLFLFAIFCYLLKQGLPMEEIRTFVFAAVGIDSILYIFSCRSLRRNIWQIKLFSNWFLWVAVGLGFSMLVAAVYLPVLQNLLNTVALHPWEILTLLGLGLAEVGLIEVTKYWFLRH